MSAGARSTGWARSTCGDAGSRSPPSRCRRSARSWAALATAFLAANRGVRGTGLVALGLGANALVVALNGAMPVSPAAATRAQVPLDDVAAGLDRRHEVSGATTRLALLGDVVPVLLPLRPEVVSPGDVLVASGLAQLVVVGMRTGRAPVPVPTTTGRAR